MENSGGLWCRSSRVEPMSLRRGASRRTTRRRATRRRRTPRSETSADPMRLLRIRGPHHEGQRGSKPEVNPPIAPPAESGPANPRTHRDQRDTHDQQHKPENQTDEGQRGVQ